MKKHFSLYIIFGIIICIISGIILACIPTKLVDYYLCKDSIEITEDNYDSTDYDLDDDLDDDYESDEDESYIHTKVLGIF